MGQYHQIACVDRMESLAPHDLGSGLKIWEQVFTYGSVRAALVALLSDSPGNQPADLAYSPLVGRWAGQRVLGIGDYAENGDIHPWPYSQISEENLYTACGYTRPSAEDRWYRDNPKGLAEAIERYEDFTKENQVLPSLSNALMGLIESGCGVRYDIRPDAGWRQFVLVKALATAIGDGKARYDLLRKRPERALAMDMVVSAAGVETNVVDKGEPAWKPAPWQREQFMKMFPGQPIPTCSAEFDARWFGFTEKDWGRAPLDGAHHNFRDDEVDQGQKRLIVSITAQEYINPVAFGEVPTTAGIMRGEDKCAAAALLLSLYHPQSRGGGDIDVDDCGIVGRWRNHRLFLSAEYPNEKSVLPSTDAVRSGMRDVSAEFLEELARLRD